MQAQISMRPMHGFSLQGTYTWARNLGSIAYTDPRNRSLDYGLNAMHRAHAMNMFGSFELPFGPNKWLFSNVSPNVVGRIIGGWQLTWIHTMQTGHPMSISAGNMLYGAGAADIVGNFDTKSGHINWKHNALTGNYFGDRYINVADPQCAAVTALQSLSSSCTLGAYADTLNNNKIVFQNPLPGTRGNFGRNNLTSALTWDTTMALMKSIRITESKSFQLRIDATNVFNHAQANQGAYASTGSRTGVGSDPILALNRTTFDMTTFSYVSRPFGYLDSKTGTRTFQARLRFDF
jgi:hypothetical protein